MATLKLTDLQRSVLIAAAQRIDGNLLPLPDAMAEEDSRIRKTMPSLIKRALVEEVTISDPALVWRHDKEGCIGLAITTAGRAAIGETPIVTVETALPAAAPSSKIGAVIAMLRRDGGATLTELVEATGWLPHTIRAALTGLRKKGHGIAKGKRDDVTCYTLAAGA